MFFICTVFFKFSGIEKSMSIVHVQHLSNIYFLQCDYVLLVFQQSTEKHIFMH